MVTTAGAHHDRGLTVAADLEDAAAVLYAAARNCVGGSINRPLYVAFAAIAHVVLRSTISRRDRQPESAERKHCPGAHPATGNDCYRGAYDGRLCHRDVLLRRHVDLDRHRFRRL